ncbi:hypothetical protein TeGR_g10945, partial [Tetraparma gracilis]
MSVAADDEGWDDWDDEEPAPTPVPAAPLQEMKHSLAEYQIGLSDSSHPSLLTCHLAPLLDDMAADMFSYYHSNPSLYEYTLSKELKRLDYTFHPSSCPASSSPFEMIKFGCSHPSPLHHLISAANQSILAPLLTLLYSPPFSSLLLPPAPFLAANFLVPSLSFHIHPTHLTASADITVQYPDLSLATASFQLIYTPVPALGDASLGITCTDVRPTLLPVNVDAALSSLHAAGCFSTTAPPPPSATLAALRKSMLVTTAVVDVSGSHARSLLTAATASLKETVINTIEEGRRDDDEGLFEPPPPAEPNPLDRLTSIPAKPPPPPPPPSDLTIGSALKSVFAPPPAEAPAAPNPLDRLADMPPPKPPPNPLDRLAALPPAAPERAAADLTVGSALKTVGSSLWGGFSSFISEAAA